MKAAAGRSPRRRRVGEAERTLLRDSGARAHGRPQGRRRGVSAPSAGVRRDDPGGEEAGGLRKLKLKRGRRRPLICGARSDLSAGEFPCGLGARRASGCLETALCREGGGLSHSVVIESGVDPPLGGCDGSRGCQPRRSLSRATRRSRD